MDDAELKRLAAFLLHQASWVDFRTERIEFLSSDRVRFTVVQQLTVPAFDEADAIAESSERLVSLGSFRKNAHWMIEARDGHGSSVPLLNAFQLSQVLAQIYALRHAHGRAPASARERFVSWLRQVADEVLKLDHVRARERIRRAEQEFGLVFVPSLGVDWDSLREELSVLSQSFNLLAIVNVKAGQRLMLTHTYTAPYAIEGDDDTKYFRRFACSAGLVVSQVRIVNLNTRHAASTKIEVCAPPELICHDFYWEVLGSASRRSRQGSVVVLSARPGELQEVVDDAEPEEPKPNKVIRRLAGVLLRGLKAIMRLFVGIPRWLSVILRALNLRPRAVDNREAPSASGGDVDAMPIGSAARIELQTSKEGFARSGLWVVLANASILAIVAVAVTLERVATLGILLGITSVATGGFWQTSTHGLTSRLYRVLRVFLFSTAVVILMAAIFVSVDLEFPSPSAACSLAAGYAAGIGVLFAGASVGYRDRRLRVSASSADSHGSGSPPAAPRVRSVVEDRLGKKIGRTWIESDSFVRAKLLMVVAIVTGLLYALLVYLLSGPISDSLHG